MSSKHHKKHKNNSEIRNYGNKEPNQKQDQRTDNVPKKDQKPKTDSDHGEMEDKAGVPGVLQDSGEKNADKTVGNVNSEEPKPVEGQKEKGGAEGKEQKEREKNAAANETEERKDVEIKGGRNESTAELQENDNGHGGAEAEKAVKPGAGSTTAEAEKAVSPESGNTTAKAEGAGSTEEGSKAARPEENNDKNDVKADKSKSAAEDTGTEQADTEKKSGEKAAAPKKLREMGSSDYVAQRREIRRKRRMRNQILAYASLVILIGLIAAGIVLTVKHLTTVRQEEALQQSKEQQEKVEEIFASEETISIPEPSESIPVEVEPTYEEKLDALVDEIIAQMSLEDKVAGLFFATPENITKVSTAVAAGDATQKALVQYPVGGIFYQSKNIQNETQITTMLSNTARYAEESANHNIFLAVSEEGGDAVTVAAKSLGEKTDSAADIGAGGDAEKARSTGNVIGEYLKNLGFNLDFAPVADLNLVEKSAVDGRSYGSDASLVPQYVTAMMLGLADKGIMPAVVQFPGTGSVTAKTEDGLASSSRTAEEFRAEEFTVFKAAIDAGANMIMVSHMSAPALDESNVPCSMSEAVVTGILRRELGFKGVIISEPMNRKAISDYYGADDAAVNALKAGCDMILAPEDFEKAYNGVLDAVRDGRISEERINDSLKRVYRIKYADRLENE